MKTVWLTSKKFLVSPPTDDPHWHSHHSSYAHYCSYHHTLLIAVTIIRSLSQLPSYAHYRSYHHTLIPSDTQYYHSYHHTVIIWVTIVNSTLSQLIFYTLHYGITVLHSSILQLPFYTLLDLSYHNTLYIITFTIVITL